MREFVLVCLVFVALNSQAKRKMLSIMTEAIPEDYPGWEKYIPQIVAVQSYVVQRRSGSRET